MYVVRMVVYTIRFFIKRYRRVMRNINATQCFDKTQNLKTHPFPSIRLVVVLPIYRESPDLYAFKTHTFYR